MKESIESLRKVLRKQFWLTWNSGFLVDKSANRSKPLQTKVKNIISVQLQGLLTGFALIRSDRQKRNPMYDKFYQNMPKVFFMFKINKVKHHNLWNEYQNRNFLFQWIILHFLPKFSQNFNYTQNKKKIKPILETSTF